MYIFRRIRFKKDYLPVSGKATRESAPPRPESKPRKQKAWDADAGDPPHVRGKGGSLEDGEGLYQDVHCTSQEEGHQFRSEQTD